MASTRMTDAAKISMLIVDDEPIARAGMRRMLAEVEWISCIGEAANGPAAIEAIDRLKPELVFLDIHMPGLLGTEVLRRVRHQPLVVFTTAYAAHPERFVRRAPTPRPLPTAAWINPPHAADTTTETP